jgi:hypothetical protein
MADTKISALTDGVFARSDDRVPLARTPFGVTDNRYLTPQYQSEYTKRFGVDPAFTSINTAGAVTLTAAQLLTGLIVADPNGAGRTYTFPTAALLVAAMLAAGHCQVGSTLSCLIVNGADAAETITLAAGAGGAFDANQTAASRVIPQNSQKEVRVRITNIGGGTEAYVMAG